MNLVLVIIAPRYLKEHGENMHQNTRNKYLGDLIHKSGKIEEKK